MEVARVLWGRGAVVITTAQLHSTKPELRLCGGLNSPRSVSEICDGEILSEILTMVPAGNKAKRPSSVNHTTKQFIIIINRVPFRPLTIKSVRNIDSLLLIKLRASERDILMISGNRPDKTFY